MSVKKIDANSKLIHNNPSRVFVNEKHEGKKRVRIE